MFFQVFYILGIYQRKKKYLAIFYKKEELLISK